MEKGGVSKVEAHSNDIESVLELIEGTDPISHRLALRSEELEGDFVTF